MTKSIYLDKSEDYYFGEVDENNTPNGFGFSWHDGRFFTEGYFLDAKVIGIHRSTNTEPGFEWL